MAICGLKISEVVATCRHQEGDVVTYRVRVDEHETGKSECAKLVLDRDIFSLLTRWTTVREAVIPQLCPYVFPNFFGVSGLRTSHL